LGQNYKTWPVFARVTLTTSRRRTRLPLTQWEVEQGLLAKQPIIRTIPKTIRKYSLKREHQEKDRKAPKGIMMGSIQGNVRSKAVSPGFPGIFPPHLTHRETVVALLLGLEVVLSH
jgi:hypothetical protein